MGRISYVMSSQVMAPYLHRACRQLAISITSRISILLCELTIHQPSFYPKPRILVSTPILLRWFFLANENLDAAGERLQKALNQLQTTVDWLLDKAERELSGSVEQMNALRDERERFEVALAEAEQKYADLYAATEAISLRLKEVSSKARSLLDG